MGANCPTCAKYQSITKVHTLDGKPPNKGSDVIFVSLACGHAFGSEEFNQYNKIANRVRFDAAEKIRAIEAETNSRISTAFAEFQANRKIEAAP